MTQSRDPYKPTRIQWNERGILNTAQVMCRYDGPLDIESDYQWLTGCACYATVMHMFFFFSNIDLSTCSLHPLQLCIFVTLASKKIPTQAICSACNQSFILVSTFCFVAWTVFSNVSCRVSAGWKALLEKRQRQSQSLSSDWANPFRLTWPHLGLPMERYSQILQV